MENNKVDIQFRYLLEWANFKCEKCGKSIHIDANSYGDLEDVDHNNEFVCEKCGTRYKLPFHYIDTYHNKQAKIVKGDEKNGR
jgi:DNA-directed RNA polymerase subunit RPC12/RpoP